MALFLGPMRKHLEGHKNLTDHEEVIKLTNISEVRIPLMNGNADCTPCVKQGDIVKVGTKIGERNDHFYVPLFASVSGTVKGIEKSMSAGLKPVDHVVIENDMKYEKEAPLTPLNYESASREELVEFMKQAGIVGCGGAGFPTYVKYGKPEGISLLIINAVECEPYITADYKYMSENLDRLVIGTKALLKMSTAKQAKVAIKVTKKDFIPKLVEAFKNEKNIEVVAVPDIYPMGWERTLVYQLIKKRYDKLPSEVGVIVNNATTAISFANALVDGMPIVNKMVTVSGDAVKAPHNCFCPVGTPAKELVEACGGYIGEECLICAGGPMMGKTITTDTWTITPYSNAITVLKPSKYPDTKCLRCARCSDNCPSGLQPVRIANAVKVNDIDRLEKLDTRSCIECGMCTFVCPSRLPVTENVRKAKRLLALKKK